MTVWDDALQTILNEDDLAEAITYYPGGSGPGVALRAIRTAPDAAEFAFGQGVVQATDVLNLAVADLAQVAVGDVFLLSDGSQLTVVSEPMRDNINIAWRVMCRR
jgi:hypothetical protein